MRSMKAPAREPPTFDHLSQELWSQIFCRVPHDSRLRCLAVSQKWYRFLMELEDELKEANPGSPRLLVLEKFSATEDEVDCEEVYRLEWFALDPVSSTKTRMKLSWPPGWDPAVHGCIQGGGRSGLVALWDRKASQYWVGSPVHDKWEKVPVLNAFPDLPFHRQGFHFIPQGRRCRRSFALKPAVPCFKPLKEWPSEDEQNAERSGFYSIVQYQVNETHERWVHERAPVHDRKFANWVIQIYSSRSRTWKVVAQPEPEFRSLIYSGVSGKSVYFLAALEPYRSPDVDEDDDSDLPCPVSVWVYELDTGALSLKQNCFNQDCLYIYTPQNVIYWRSLQLRVTKGGDVCIICVGDRFDNIGVEWDLLKLVCKRPSKCWALEKKIELDELCNGDTGFDELIDSDSEDWGFNFLAFNPSEGYLDDIYDFAYSSRDYVPADYQYRAEREFDGVTFILYFSKQERLWKHWTYLNCPLREDGVLPVVAFLPCCDLPCSTGVHGGDRHA